MSLFKPDHQIGVQGVFWQILLRHVAVRSDRVANSPFSYKEGRRCASSFRCRRSTCGPAPKRCTVVVLLTQCGVDVELDTVTCVMSCRLFTRFHPKRSVVTVFDLLLTRYIAWSFVSFENM